MFLHILLGWRPLKNQVFSPVLGGWVPEGQGGSASGWGVASLTPTPRRHPPQFQGAQRKLQEQEGEFRARERGLLGSLEEARGAEKQQLDHARSLELKLEGARAEAAELGLRLSAAEGRAQGLETELARVEAQRRSAEAQLGGLRSALRRGLGLGRSPSPAPRPPPGFPAGSAPAGGELCAAGKGRPVGAPRGVPAPTSRSVPPTSPQSARRAPTTAGSSPAPSPSPCPPARTRPPGSRSLVALCSFGDPALRLFSAPTPR